MANVEAVPETSIFRSWGSLRRVFDSDGKRIDYAVPVEPDSSQDRVHSNGVNGTGVSIELLTGSRI